MTADVGEHTRNSDVPAVLYDRSRHGDADAQPGLADFAVNVRPGPPGFVADALASRIGDLAAYPSAAEVASAAQSAADLHGRRLDEVLLLAGAAEGFELLARLGARHVALIQPSFTEPERVLRASGARISQVTPSPPWRLADAAVPADADLVIVGNPTNPTSVLHPATDILALRRPGRILVVDEAFADLTLDPLRGAEPESVAAELADDVIVIRSVTKTFGLAGLRAGYLLAAPDLIARMTAGRRHWPVGTLTLAALTACLSRRGQDHAAEQARIVADDRQYLLAALESVGLRAAVAPSAPYVLVREPEGWKLKAELAWRGIAVRSCANFVGLDADYLRFAVRPPESSDALVAAVQDVRRRSRWETTPR
ncbi:Rv2231c family pyridoxal phosphate-dependent protein CobC [Gordonia zhaorongruii]|uniref:Rv2231c family pyridoxal phosphate-dependent protein CobC n=1 Tax=Gordonia zhaorongruii TaxID=2597659 RepID=UPI001046F7B7|nr:Rv2231c family pyridoxal phosphate-dependent protein CobC [Gordonia zhaorongruii]